MPITVDEIIDVLREVPEYQDGHHMQRPFLTAYQIAIRFSQRFPSHPSVTHLPLGGKDTGQYQSLAQTIARFLSQKLASGGGQGIEGGFLSHQDIQSIELAAGTTTILPSTLKTKEAESIFRYAPR